ncbi:MAG: hypothetical protein HYR88_13720 [Verrucomicrobia bacterium]|nr:hypothetical protein [Verrucomicrobiota bacterium]MBI3871260.1 hypothetical protein [Verrucomicrobiota bacterium]
MRTDNDRSVVPYAVALLGAFAIVGVLAVAMKNVSAPPSLNAARSQERSKALTETRAAAEAEINSYAKIDGAKGIYRLKVSQAVALTEQMYRANPDAARSNLVSRSDKANFIPTFE